VYQLSPAVRSTRNEDGGVVLDISRGQMFRLNPVGALILESLAHGCAEAEIIQEITRQYNIGEEAAATDVREFLKSLEEHQLVNTVNSGRHS